MTVRAYVGVGSNIAPREHVPQAVARLEACHGGLIVSPVYACPAVGFDGPAFMNLVVGLDTDQAPAALAAGLREIEAACGRSYAARSGSRTMDLDLLLYGDLVDPALRLPRADILRYAFTLKPLADIAPKLRHPQTGERFRELWAAFSGPGQPLELSDFQIHNQRPQSD